MDGREGNKMENKGPNPLKRKEESLGNEVFPHNALFLNISFIQKWQKDHMENYLIKFYGVTCLYINKWQGNKLKDSQNDKTTKKFKTLPFPFYFSVLPNRHTSILFLSLEINYPTRLLWSFFFLFCSIPPKKKFLTYPLLRQAASKHSI